MKKTIRIVWISALSGLAFLTACWSHKGLTRKERKQLTEERVVVERELKEKQAYVEGNEWDPYDVFFFNKQVYALQNRLDSIDFRLGDSIDLDRNIRRRQILQRIDSLSYLVKREESACVYGPPPGMYEDYDKEQAAMESDLKILRRQLKEAKQELKDFDHFQTQGREVHEKLYGGPDVYYNRPQTYEEKRLLEENQRKLDSIQRKKEAQRKRDSIRQARRNNDRSCVYGPPPSPSPSTCGVSNADVKSTTTKLNDLVNDWSMASTPAEKAEKKASFDAIVKSFDAKLNEADCRKLDPKLLKNYEFVKKLIK